MVNKIGAAKAAHPILFFGCVALASPEYLMEFEF
jgi:hypothetical protein